MRKTLPFILLLLSCTPQQSEERTRPVNRWGEERSWQVLKAQDHRRMDSLLVWLAQGEMPVRHAAALAFASVQDTAAIPWLEAALEDPEPMVRNAAAYALGFVLTGEKAEALVAWALSRIDTAVGSAYSSSSVTSTLTRALEKDSAGAMFLLRKGSGYERIRAADAIRRWPKERIQAMHGPYVKLVRNEKDPEVQSALLGGVRHLETTAVKELVLKLTDDPIVVVRISALRTLGGFKDPAFTPILLAHVINGTPGERRTALDQLENVAHLDVDQIMAIHERSKDRHIAIGLLGLALRHGNKAQQDRYRKQLNEEFATEQDPYLRGEFVTALANDPNKEKAIARCEEVVRGTGHSVERFAAFDAAMYLHGDRTTGQVELLLRVLKGQRDAGMIAAACQAVTARKSYQGFVHSELVEVLRSFEGTFDMPRDLETARSVVSAIAHLEGKPEPNFPAPPASSHPIDRTRLEALPNGQLIRMTTTRGIVDLALDVDAAPGSCLAFDSLVQAGYYDGKAFHRVVPNFVAQGGCPRGDGWGSMDWTLRTEVGTSGFGTGSVGLASAGRDTESCQFFIMLAPAPHLDGRYTRFAQVVQGMDVVEALQIGDTITRMERVGTP